MEFNSVNRIIQRLAQVSKKMDKGIETFIQPGRKRLRKAEEAFRKFTSHGYRQIPLEPVGENEALEASATPRAEVDENAEKVKSSRGLAMEFQILP